MKHHFGFFGLVVAFGFCLSLNANAMDSRSLIGRTCADVLARSASSSEVIQKTLFQPVAPGQFSAEFVAFDRESNRWEEIKGQYTLTHSFEAMATQVTQAMWVELMGRNPSHFSRGSSEVGIEQNGEVIYMQPDYPAENMTWWAAAEFANRYSIKMGLEPVYDFSGVRFAPSTSPEDGTWAPESGFVRINAPGGNIYRAEGYRLPTFAEQVFLLTNRGRLSVDDLKQIVVSQSERLARSAANTDESTRPVTALGSLNIDGHEFFGLLGNVYEMNSEVEEPDGSMNRIDPFSRSMEFTDMLRTSIGKSYKIENSGRDLTQLHYYSESSYQPTRGLRLFRTTN